MATQYEREDFETAVRKGEYISAVNKSLNAQADPDANMEKLRERLFFGQQPRVFEHALREAVSTNNSNWLLQMYRNIPDYWTAPDELIQNRDYSEYRLDFLRAQLISAMDVVCGTDKSKTDSDFKFTFCLSQDFGHIFQNPQLSPLHGSNRVKVPVLLLNEHKKGYIAFLFIEQVDTRKNSSSPYPHPIKMSDIPIDDDFKTAVDNAFQTVRDLLNVKDSCPVWRWWVESEHLTSIKGPSLYGAFIVGMYGSAFDLKIFDNITITCSGDAFGKLASIGGLVQKYQAAMKDNLKIVVSGAQDYDSEDNLITDDQKKRLLVADTANDVFKHFFTKKWHKPILGLSVAIITIFSYAYTVFHTVILALAQLKIIFRWHQFRQVHTTWLITRQLINISLGLQRTK